MEKIISAVIGCGRMGAFTSSYVKEFCPNCWFPLSHIEALQQSDSTYCSAASDISEAQLEMVRSTYNVDKTFSDYHQMLEEIQPDLLCVATRTPERVDVIKAAIANGVRALHIEKPLCNSMKELTELRNLANENGTIFTYGTIRRYFDIYKKAKELVNSGQFGRLQQIEIAFGSGQLFWTHPHSVDLILFFAGERQLLSVQAKLSNVVTPRPNIVLSDPDVDLAAMHFSDGVVGIIGKSSGMNIILSCENGQVLVEADGKKITCKKTRGESPYHSPENHTLPALTARGTLSAISQLTNSLLGNTEETTELDGNYIFLGQETLFAFVKSHLMGGAITKMGSIDHNITILGKTDNRFA